MLQGLSEPLQQKPVVTHIRNATTAVCHSKHSNLIEGQEYLDVAITIAKYVRCTQIVPADKHMLQADRHGCRVQAKFVTSHCVKNCGDLRI
jgi:hypothetical protein